MKKLFILPVVLIAVQLSSCGNDPAVESSYVSAMEKGISQLKETHDIDGLVRAQDLLDSAKSLPGVMELSKSESVKDVEQRFTAALEAAQDRVMNGLLSEASDTVIHE